jgi:hypothetical protein
MSTIDTLRIRCIRYSPGANLFFVYAQRSDIAPQLPPSGQGQSNQKGPYPEPSTGMHILKRARRTDGSIMGDLVPRFGKHAKRQSAVLGYSSEFWLNKYILRTNSLFCAILDLIGGCADALAGILEVAKCRSVCHWALFCPFFPHFFYLVSSSAVNISLSSPSSHVEPV